MATIQEIEERAADIRAAESRALRNLADHLREAVVDMPVESQLTLAFAKRARTFEHAARASNIAHEGKQELCWSLTQDINEALGDAQPSKVASDLLREAAELIDNERMVHAISKIANYVDAWGGLS